MRYITLILNKFDCHLSAQGITTNRMIADQEGYRANH